MTESKRCTRCGEVKSLDEFHRSANHPDGHVSRCKHCRRDVRQAAREKKPPGGPRFPELYDVEWLKQRYLVEHLSAREIADLLGCKGGTVSHALRRAGIVRIPLALQRALRAKRDREGEGAIA